MLTLELFLLILQLWPSPLEQQQVQQEERQQLQQQQAINPPLDWSKLLFGGKQQGGFLGFGESQASPIPTPTAITNGNTTNPSSRLDSLEQRIKTLEQGGSSAFFGGARRRKTIKKRTKKYRR